MTILRESTYERLEVAGITREHLEELLAHFRRGVLRGETMSVIDHLVAALADEIDYLTAVRDEATSCKNSDEVA